MKTAIFTALFGIQEDKLVKKIVPLSSHSDGIFGQVQSAYMAKECQGHGNLHGHCPVWIELTPNVLQRLGDQELLKQVVAEAIDTMTISSMGLSDPIKCVICASMGHRHCWAMWQKSSGLDEQCY